MSGQQWEYCELRLAASEKVTPGMREKWAGGDSYDCSIRYCNPAGQEIRHVLTELKAKPAVGFNPFLKAMALLGIYGWELVSVQHGNASYVSYNSTWSLEWDNAVAYFKRLIVAGRAVNEPELVL